MLRTSRLLSGLAVVSIISILTCTFLLVDTSNFHPVKSLKWLLPIIDAPEKTPIEIPLPSPEEDSHPIIDLLRKAEAAFDDLLGEETNDLSSAAAAYRERRGRHPPPGFDRWHRYAVKNKAVMIEELWDQIYHDLNPFWALDQKHIRLDGRGQKAVIRIRDGDVSSESDFFWVRIWMGLFETISDGLPDMDVAINTMDEPRMLIPWEDMAGYVGKEQKERKLLPEDQVIQKYTVIEDIDAEVVPYNDELWSHDFPVFDYCRHSCPPDSLARQATIQTNFSNPPILSNEFTGPHTYEGYVSNYTLSLDICHQPDLQGLHGWLVEPISVKNGDKLVPYFGSSKISLHSEILLPAAMYYDDDPNFQAQAPPIPWEIKTDTLFWRGLASGGRNHAENWKAFHRHRLISMLNGTQALQMPGNSSFIDIQNLPLDSWNLSFWDDHSKPRNELVGEWLNSFTDVGFTGLACFPPEDNDGCSYTNYLFATHPRVNLLEQHRHKYLVDVDGNSFSGRYRDFLLSGSLPIKATLFKEWHDSRLIAWKHFVPFDNRFLDLYGILEFFLGKWNGRDQRREGGRDELARKIAHEGQWWANKVLRKEDMRIYTYRLLLEYARVVDENRERLGWVEDLLGDR